MYAAHDLLARSPAVAVAVFLEAVLAKSVSLETRNQLI